MTGTAGCFFADMDVASSATMPFMLTAIVQGWMRPFRSVSSVDIFHVDLSPHGAREASCATLLDRKELSRADRFLYPGPRRRFILLRAALRDLLCDRLDCDNDNLSFGSAEHGKPFALVGDVPAAIQFNVSDSGRHGLIAIAPQGQIGIDAEERSTARDLDGLAETVFGPDEQAYVASARGPEKVHRFYRLWTMKEALLKALGTGLYLDVSSFQVPETLLHGESGAEFRFPQFPEARWWVEDLGVEDFAAAIASEMVEAGGPAAEDMAGGQLASAWNAAGNVGS